MNIVITNIRCRNLDLPELLLPTSGLVAVTGVSGSGKSTLLHEVLGPTLQSGTPTGCESARGVEPGSEVVVVDGKPLGRSPASTVATFSGALEVLRKRFAKTAQAQALGLKAGAFSSTSKHSRCPACKGMGQVKVSMDFLADVWIPCEQCNLDRYVGAVLECRWRNRNVVEWLQTTVEEAASAFDDDRQLAPILEMLTSVGLGYLRLGQPVATLSGGEAQRLKLASELVRNGSDRTPPTFFLLDEPTCGLHRKDVEQLLVVLDKLVDHGHLVMVVEHNLALIRHADYIIDLGPGGGPDGGKLVVAGTPETVATCKHSHTGAAMRTTIPFQTKAQNRHFAWRRA